MEWDPAHLLQRMRRGRLRVALNYAIPIVTVAVAAASMYSLFQAYGRSYSSLLMIAICLSSWYGGIGPGFLASGLSAIVINYLFQAPRFSFAVVSARDVWQLVIFGATAVIVTVFSRQRRQYQAVALAATYQALHDPLTGLPNRVLLEDRLAQALRVAARDEQAVEVVLIDLDGFKEINDTYGHEIGDAVLKEVAQRIQSAIRESDTVCRLGGDEFVLILGPFPPTDLSIPVSSKIVAAIERPVTVGSHELRVGASVGSVRYPQGGLTKQELLDAADLAMYAEKRQRKLHQAIGTAPS